MANKKRLEQQRERRARYTQGWRDLGIDDRIISRLDLRNKNPERVADELMRDIKTQSRTQKAKTTRERKARERESILVAEGYKKSEIKKKWLASDKHLYAELGRTNPNTVYKATSHLALCFTPVNGADFIGTSDLKKYTFAELKSMIRKRVESAKRKPKGSSDMSCVFQMFHGSESECESALNDFNKRGYNLSVKKLTDARYYRMVNRNDWTMREFAELTYAVIRQSHNRDVEMHINQLRDFAEENGLPFNEIFE